MSALIDQPKSVAKPRFPKAAAPIGIFALWSLAVCVMVCLILLSLVEGAAERKRMRSTKAPRRAFWLV